MIPDADTNTHSKLTDRMATRSPILTATALLAFADWTLANPGPCIQWVGCNLTSTAAIAMRGVAAQGPAQLPETLRCGQLVVPMNYSQPLSPENNITLGFSIYRPPKPLGLINLCVMRMCFNSLRDER